MLLQPGLSGHPEPVMHTLRKRPPQSETRLLTREPPPFQLNFGQPNAANLTCSTALVFMIRLAGVAQMAAGV